MSCDRFQASPSVSALSAWSIWGTHRLLPSGQGKVSFQASQDLCLHMTPLTCTVSCCPTTPVCGPFLHGSEPSLLILRDQEMQLVSLDRHGAQASSSDLRLSCQTWMGKGKWRSLKPSSKPQSLCLPCRQSCNRRERGKAQLFFFSFLFYFLFYFNFILFFNLYIIVLVLPNIQMNPPQVYMCSPS